MTSTRGVNLNALAPRTKGGYDWGAQQRGVSSGAVTIHFGDVASAAEEFIRGSAMLVGCVAWTKSRRLVAALAERPVALVVNKEFGLRVQGHPEREALMPLTGGVPSKALPAPRPTSASLAPVRCAGWAAKGRFGALMHHKFLVRLNTDGQPTSVWTGSFNLTAGAENNIENGMVIDDPQIARAFLAEFARVWALSEPLLFSSGTPTPGSNAKVQVRPAKVNRTSKTAPRRKPAPKKIRTASAKPSPKAASSTKTSKPASPRRNSR